MDLFYLLYCFALISEKLLDVVSAIDEETTVVDTFTKLCENVDSYSGELFTEAVKLVCFNLCLTSQSTALDVASILWDFYPI